MYDIFISYAKEDKEVIALPLAETLSKRGYKVWYDEFALSVGDSLTASIDKGIGSAKYGIVILSKSFFQKNWTNFEYVALTYKNVQNPGKLLPIWYNVTCEDVQKFSTSLANIHAIIYNGQSIKEIVKQLEYKIGEYRYQVDKSGQIIRSQYKTRVPQYNIECNYQTIKSINTDELIDNSRCVTTQDVTIYPYTTDINDFKFNFWQHTKGQIRLISHMVYNCLTGELINCESEIIKNDGTHFISSVKFKLQECAPIRVVCKIETTELHTSLFVNGYSDMGFTHKKAIELFSYYFVMPNLDLYKDIIVYVNDKEHPFVLRDGKLEFEYTERKIKPGTETKFNFRKLSIK